MPQLTLQQAHDLAVQLYNAGQFAEAADVCGQVLAVVTGPHAAPMLFLMGLAKHELGKADEAVALLRQTVAAQPGAGLYHSGLGLVLSRRGDGDAALAALAEAVRLEPRNHEFRLNLGVVLQAAGRTAESIDAFRAAVAIKPDYTDAVSNLAVLLSNQNQTEEAEQLHRLAIAQRPADARLHVNLGEVLRVRGRPDEAIACFRAAVELDPQLPNAYSNWGNVLKDRGELDEAVALYRQAIERSRGHWMAYNNLGAALKDQGRLDEAMANYRRAMLANPAGPGANTPHSNLIYTMQFDPRSDLAAIAAEQARWSERFADPLFRNSEAAGAAGSAVREDPDRRLRIGYVSPYFFEHAESHFVVPLLEAHDRAAVELHAFSTAVKNDAVTQRVRNAVDHWHECATLSDVELAQRVRDARIDILIDLTMHMAESRLLAFARRPAPVQVTWLAYPGTTGLRTIDYRLTDAHMEPASAKDRGGAVSSAIEVDDGRRPEQPLRLPDSWVCYHPLGETPPVGPLPAAETGRVTFGSLNNFCKVNSDVLRLWARVLAATPRSSLLLLAPAGSARDDARAMLAAHGIDASRVDFTAIVPRYDYLALYHRIDIALDPFPYNGITTTCDALWMGVPVFSIAGPVDRPASRAGLGLLMAAGVPELVCTDEDHFVYRTATLARDLPRMQLVRASLRDRVATSALTDGPRFARHVEAAFRAAWREWCAAST